jgi:hypothetical protein
VIFIKRAKPQNNNSNGITAENIPSADLMKNPEMCAPITPSQLLILLKLLSALSESKKSPKKVER